MPKRTRDYHSWLIKRLADPREAERYLKVAMGDSPQMFLKALRNVAEAKKMAKVAEEAGVNRESLYKALSEDGNPAFFTVEAVLNAVGMSLMPQLKEQHTAASTPNSPIAIQAERNTPSIRALTGAAHNLDLAAAWTTTDCLVVSTSATSLSARGIQAPPEIPIYLLESEKTASTIDNF